MSVSTIDNYLDELKKCTDTDRLRTYLKVQDNYPVFLYGERAELFFMVTEAFRNSPSQNGIRDSFFNPRTSGDSTWLFDYRNGAVTVQVNMGTNHMYGDQRIGDLDHSVWVMFHSQPERYEEGVGYKKAMALAIASFGEYIEREKLTARFPRVNLNYIPN
ncbi:MAG TPA: hypothetical protein VJJ52_02860 [Candidatus Nanoarchaeia archaeon]|nr:hypothetical protein [Candidatus Nanoarchaeia archaeon]